MQILYWIKFFSNDQVISSLRRALQPSVTDLSIKFDVPSSFKVYQAPEEVPTLFSGDKVVVYGIMKKRKSASAEPLRVSMNGTATLTGQILSKPIEFKITFEIPPPSDFQSSFGMPIVHHLASKSLICELQSGESWMDAATTKKQKNKIVNLSIESGVVSSHTAYIALDEGQDKLIEGAIKTWDVVAIMTQYPESMSPPRQGMHRSKNSSCSQSMPYSTPRVTPSIADLRAHSSSLDECIYYDCLSLQGFSLAKYSSYDCSPGSNSGEECSLSMDEYPENSHKAQGILGSTTSMFRRLANRKRKRAQPALLGRTDDLELTTAQKFITRPKTELELLISLQKAEGFWGLDVLQLLNFVLPFISDSIKEIYATVYTLAYMEIKFPSQRDEWELVARKAEQWLEHQTLPDQIDLEELKKEASGYIIDNLIELI